MRLQLKENLWGLGDDYTVRDEFGRTVFIIDGKVFTLRKTLLFNDPAGQTLAILRKQMFAFGPTFEIEMNGRIVAEVRKELFTFFKARFTVDVAGPDDLEAAGDFMSREFTFTRGGRPVAEVSKRWFAFGDTYGIDLDDRESPLLITAAAVVIDLCCHERRD
jgi:uncharacterized protein YxjI